MSSGISSGRPNINAFVCVTARPFGVQRPMLAIHGGMTSNGKNDPPIIISGNTTIVVSMFAPRWLAPRTWRKTK